MWIYWSRQAGGKGKSLRRFMDEVKEEVQRVDVTKEDHGIE